MTGNACIVFGNTRMEPKLSFHCFPKGDDKRAKWLKVFGLSESQFKSHCVCRVCSRRFRDFRKAGSQRRHFNLNCGMVGLALGSP